MLIRMFIKDYENTSSPVIREKYGMLGSFVGIFSNVLLFVVKLTVGMLLKSVAVMADSFNNLLDCASSLITLIGFKMGNKPADKEHPFGHGRMEYISALVVSFIIMVLGIEFLKASVVKIFKPEPVGFSIVSISILLVTIAVKLWQSFFNKALGKRINSQALVATSADSRNDVIVTSATVLSILIGKFTSWSCDGYFGAFVALFLIYSGFSLLNETLSPLLGEAADKELAQKIKDKIAQYDGVVGFHDLLIHNYGPNKSLASIHAEVPHDVDINVSHEIIDKIERDILNEMGVLITIHMDPVDVNDNRITVISHMVFEITAKYDKEIDTHDFRIVDGVNNINVIFDLCLPYDFDTSRQRSLMQEIREKVHLIDQRYTCVMNVEKSYE